MQNAFSGQARSLSDPAISLFEITPDDGVDLPHVTLGLNVATPGTVRVTTADGSTGDVTIHPGHLFPLRVARVWQTGTSATGIRGLA